MQPDILEESFFLSFVEAELLKAKPNERLTWKQRSY
jgi:hypothetical protein